MAVNSVLWLNSKVRLFFYACHYKMDIFFWKFNKKCAGGVGVVFTTDHWQPDVKVIWAHKPLQDGHEF
jgi:hypothetical protein